MTWADWASGRTTVPVGGSGGLAADCLAEVYAAVERHGARDVRLTPLSSPGVGRKATRGAFRVDDARGTVLKARRLESAETAARLADLRAPLDAGFAPVLARHDTVLLEEWIDGDTLAAPAAEACASEIGALLGRLHATPAAATLPPVSTAATRARATAQLAALTRHDIVTTAAAQALQTRLERSDPGTTPQTLVHLDFCPENIVRDRHGRLVAIDNEWITRGAPGADLGRTYARWPMAETAWRRMLRGYASTSPFAPTALDFWLVAMAIYSAALRLPQAPAALAGPAALLRRLAAGDPPPRDDA